MAPNKTATSKLASQKPIGLALPVSSCQIHPIPQINMVNNPNRNPTSSVIPAESAASSIVHQEPWVDSPSAESGMFRAPNSARIMGKVRKRTPIPMTVNTAAANNAIKAIFPILPFKGFSSTQPSMKGNPNPIWFASSNPIAPGSPKRTKFDSVT